MNNNLPQVEILLSSYNGEQFLREQLDSLINQTYLNWRLLIRDDGSTDNTIHLIEEYRVAHPGKIKIIPDEKQRLGACFAFASLLSQSRAPYVMFCDQDDVWLPEKIKTTIESMLEGERQHPGLPILVHTDMLVADNELNIVSDSFWRFQHISPERKKLQELLLLNNITGCTLMANRALVTAALPFPPEAIIHDWWLALVAAGLGRIIHIEAPMLKYRQHGGNVLGAARYSYSYFVGRLTSLGLTIDLLHRIIRQAAAFHARYQDKLSSADRDITNSFSSLLDQGRISRLAELIRRKFSCHGFLRSLGIFTLLLLIKKRTPEKERPV